MGDRISLHGLRVPCVIGVHPAEREEAQVVEIDLDLSTDTKSAGEHDRLTEAVDYEALAAAVSARIRLSSYQLIEALAEAVARQCLQHPRVEAVRVRVTKRPPIRGLAAVSVEIDRARP